MAAKNNKGKKSPTKMTANISRRSQYLLNMLLRKSPLLKNMSYPCTTKSWRTTTRPCHSSGDLQWPQLYRLSDTSSNSSTPNFELHGVVFINFDYVHAWMRHKWTTVDPFDAEKRCMQFTNIIAFDDKFYGLSLQGSLAVMQEVDSRRAITDVGSCRAVPSASARFFKEYLVGMDGEILLVFLMYQKSLRVVDDVEVFRLCLQKLKWIMVGSLEGKVLFLDECCRWGNSREIGCRGNCVYFTQSSDNGWWRYDMRSHCISSVQLENVEFWGESHD
ncbi:UNVERIFIED_CONTAM: hypothetical protein Sradi_5079500 [Sesamum radiatum]|uniref:KIB1-4 beta-propeller domain-containing protein n=1 Tax=Sesamum radiatum TaxID=300843 RepID=A0AAW2M224_SESRA